MPEPTKVQHENWTGKIKHILPSGKTVTIYYKLENVEAAQTIGCLNIRTRGREGGYYLHWWKMSDFLRKFGYTLIDVKIGQLTVKAYIDPRCYPQFVSSAEDTESAEQPPTIQERLDRAVADLPPIEGELKQQTLF